MNVRVIDITVEGSKAQARGPFPFDFLKLISRLAGRKKWEGSKAVTFEFNGANKRIVEDAEEQSAWALNWIDKSGTIAQIEALENMPTQAMVPSEPRLGEYRPALPLFKHQGSALAVSQDRTDYAYLLEMGLGKTAIAIANAGYLWAADKIDAMLVIAPKGVHRQWIKEEIPTHGDPRMGINAWEWNGAIPPTDQWKLGKLNVLSVNIDAIRTEKGYQACHDFLTRFSGRSMMIIDESHTIKNPSAKRTKLAIALGRLATYRRIATGTPIAKNLLDAYAQFLFLNPEILGHRYMTSFRSRYCVMGGFEGKQIIGHKNTEEFYTRIAPHAFRLTKAEALDLPPKQYVKREYDMGGKTARHYRELKAMHLTMLDSGQIVDAVNAAVAVLRLQQVLCGYIPLPEGGVERLGDERLDEMMEIVRQTEGPTVIWARFKMDIERITEALEKECGEGCAVQYYGETSQKNRAAAVAAYRAGEARFFVSNPAAGGTGLNLQGDCQNVIYYSNSFDALHRWQSEDRTHRMGMKGTVTYYDLVANKSVDRIILNNLRSKKSMSDLTLDEIRQMIAA